VLVTAFGQFLEMPTYRMDVFDQQHNGMEYLNLFCVGRMGALF